ncbi:MAG: sodium-translocating pyrophosphatase [Candidatus Heimdallarchaeum endolithica]|uniref:K(+)-insensitive pyrophosphate-energized proton pump n=1 Tax=Candidatus Heimdallarchaeum endolithica TaxID=2876572 RepID=A0A9Y1FQ07_9ARCH|nr:MAG: sodium-translocating pyrophosphatase [Candidatus Heimdallarchaeum endolithica]
MAVPLILLVSLIAGVISIGMAVFFAFLVMKEDPGNEKMQEVSGYIEKGAETYLKVQYTVLSIFVFILFLVILLFLPSDMTNHKVPVVSGDLNWEQAIAYLIGSAASMIAGWLGMMVGVKANTRAAQGCTVGTKKGFDIAFFGGAVMGLAVVGAALIGVSGLYWIFQSPYVVLGFSFGASTIALFMKCGGGIYTKTADVGADLVGKSEFDLPEDDVRNPATIADNVGDNVGDLAGMGSDLFDSYVASIVAAMILANSLILTAAKETFIVYPLVLSGIGLIASLIGIFIIKLISSDNPGRSLNLGTYLATLIFAALGALIVWLMTLNKSLTEGEISRLWRNYFAVILGLASGIVIGWTSDYFTRDDLPPTRNIAKAAEEGDALVILSGFSYGLISVVPPGVGIIIAMFLAYLLDAQFGVAMAAVGMLAIVGTIVSNDAYGPIVDNSRAIAEQGGLGEETIRIADRLDSAGNTAKAITKGFAIGAANLAVVALMFSYAQEAGIIESGINLLSVNVLIGAFFGVMAPALFSAVLILGVQKNAAKMVDEIRRQFKENPKILTGEEPADFSKTISIATKGSLKQLILPSLISILLPLLVGIFFGVASLGAFLAGSILSGFVFAIFMSNAGGAWDNAKKWIEDGNLGGKGTHTHKSAITGDTVGDPFKDTAGPSINTLLVVMSLTSSIFMGILMLINGGAGLIPIL